MDLHPSLSMACAAGIGITIGFMLLVGYYVVGKIIINNSEFRRWKSGPWSM